MKVLFYNWVDYVDPEKRGGGVSLYQRNLLAELKDRKDVSATFLASGISYDPFRNTPRWDQIRHGPSTDRNRRYEIVNSGVLSPGHHSFGMRVQVTHPPTESAFFDFLKAKGPFDIVHFNNLEGIPARALRVKERFPNTRVICAFHNYYPLCPQVNLWFRERESCSDFGGGRKCVECLPGHMRANPADVRRANAIAFALKRMGIVPGGRGFDVAFGRALRLYAPLSRLLGRVSREARAARRFPADLVAQAPDGASDLDWSERNFEWRRQQMVAEINAHADAVLCVSDRVGAVARRYGIRPDLTATSYIGTPHAARYAETKPKRSFTKPDGTLTIAYLGYMRLDKGFFFLLEALESLPHRLASRIHVVLAAKKPGDGNFAHRVMSRIDRLGRRFASLRHVDGYTQDDIDDVLEDVDVGLVPVMWEDNLPQVAIEMHARHIPLLTSDLGGARELGNFPPMVFRAGDINALHAKVESILSGRVSVRAYWREAMAPVSMSEHADALIDTYRRLLADNSGTDTLHDSAASTAA